MSASPHILFAGGGTAGHLFSGIAVAEAIVRLEPGAGIAFVGSGRAFERREVLAAGFTYHAAPCRPLPRGFGQAMRFVADNVRGYIAARRLLVGRIAGPHAGKSVGRRASHVVGLGGYVSVPTARAALGLGIPLSLIEQNTVPGRATRFLAPRAERVFLGWEEARAQVDSRWIEVTGVPIRTRFRELIAERDRAERDSAERGTAETHRSRNRECLVASGDAAPLLLVLGGSLGARPLNEQAPLAIAAAKSALTGWRVVHQTGEPHLAATAALYDRLGITACVTPFVDDMPTLLAGASLVVTRAGGSTLAELAGLGVPSIVLPLLTSADDHQRRNAHSFAAAGACLHIEAPEFAEPLAAALRQLATDARLRTCLSLAARQTSRPAAAGSIASTILARAAAATAPQSTAARRAA